MKSILKHDKYVNELKHKISSNYDLISTHVPFHISHKSIGEVDIIARKGKKVDLYEVKCSNKIGKATKQLNRAKKHIGVEGDLYFYCGSSGVLLLIN